MTSLKIFVLVLIVLIVFCFYFIFLEIYRERKIKFFRTGLQLKNNFIVCKKKYDYKMLSYSKSIDKIFLISITKGKKIFCQKYLHSKLDDLKKISLFIDEKINNCNQKFRAKNGYILIEQIASVVAFGVFSENKCKLFSEFKKYQICYHLKQKENKIFKLLLGRFLIDNLYDIETEIQEISRIIHHYKTANKFKNYKKQIYKMAEIYSIKKFNPNATKILDGYEFDYATVMQNLFDELSLALEEQKVIISYLLVMYSN